MTLRRAAAWAAFALAGAASVACAAEHEPDVLRYFSAAHVAEVDAYVRPYYVQFWVTRLVTLAWFAAFLVFGANRWLYARGERMVAWAGERTRGGGALARAGAVFEKLWGDATWKAALAFTGLYFGLAALIDLPRSFYFGWWYERANGMSVASLQRWAGDEMKGHLVEIFFFSCLAFGLFGLARRLRRWWLVLGLPCALLLMLAGVLDPFREMLYTSYVPLEQGATRAAITDTLARGRVEYEGIYVLKKSDVTRRANAFFVGQGPTRRIVLWDTVLAAFTPAEVANIVAHEVGHLKDSAVQRPVIAGAAVLPLLWLVAVSLRAAGRKGRYGFDDDRDVRSLPAVLFLMFVLTSVADPASALYSRHLETEADGFALGLLRQPREFRSMMVKLVRVNKADVHPPAWSRVISSHPPALERIHHAERWAEAHGGALEAPAPEMFELPPQSTAPLEVRAAP